MPGAHDHGSGVYWNKYDSKFKHHHAGQSGGTVGLVFILVLIMGMFFYIGSFYWDRAPLPEVSKKQKPNESHFDLLPVPSFEKNYG